MGEFEQRERTRRHFKWLNRGKPERDTRISKDEIISLKIDLNVLTADELYEKYFSGVRV